MIRKTRLLTLALCSILLGSCSNDDNNEEAIIGKNDVLISSILPNPDGQSGSEYMQLINGIETASYTNKKALPVGYGYPPTIIGNDIFLLPGWSMSNNIFAKYSKSNGKLNKIASLVLPDQSGANAIVTKGNKAYISLSKLGKILIVDHIKMEKIGEIDITSYAVGDKNPDPSQMIIRDNLLYVGLNQLVGGPTPDPKRAKVDVLIIDTNNDKPIKMITEEKSGFSMPTKPEADPNSIFMDEQGDIYINCISGFGMIGHKSGFLRIKNGETEFDDSYQFDITNTTVEGEKNRANYIVMLKYKEKGIVYASGKINAYYSDPVNYIKDRTIMALKIDLNTKTIKKLPLPSSNNFSTGVSFYKDLVIFGLATTKDIGFYTYNPINNKSSDNAIIKTEGYPYSFEYIN